MPNKIQNDLDLIYSKELDKAKIIEDFSTQDLCSFSAPFLIDIPKNYEASSKKILYIGKETNLWWGKLRHFVDINDSIKILKKRYKAEFFNGEVETSKDMRKLKKYKGRDWKNNAFFSKFKFFEKEIDNSCLIWTNLLKMDSGEAGYSKNSINDERVKSYSKNILLQEIRALKPDAIIFVTATSTNLKKYDTAIKDTFNNSYTNSKVIESGKLWIFEFEGIKCYRTLHPLSYQFRKIEHDYYQDIAQDINNKFQLFKDK